MATEVPDEPEDESRRPSDTSTILSTVVSSSSYSTYPTPASSGSPDVSNTAKTGDEQPDTEMAGVSPPATPIKQENDSALPSAAASSSSSSSSTQIEKPSVQAIVTHLESIVRTFMDAVNTRQLLPENPVHDNFDKRFATTSPPPWPPDQEDYKTYIARLDAITHASPSYSMDNVLLDTHVYKNGHAGVFVTCEVNGVPPGVKRTTVAIFRFRKRDGQWRCFTVEEVIHGGGGVVH